MGTQKQALVDVSGHELILYIFLYCSWSLFYLFHFTQAELRPNLLGKEILPVLHTGGEGVHTSSYGANGETRLDNWVRVEKHSLDNIQNICVSVQVGTFTHK